PLISTLSLHDALPISYTIDIFMELVRNGGIERTRLIGEIETVKSRERPILTRSGLTGIPVQASSRIAAAAIRFALGIQSGIGTADRKSTRLNSSHVSI